MRRNLKFVLSFLALFLCFIPNFVYVNSSSDFWEDANKWYNGDEFHNDEDESKDSDYYTSDVGNIEKIAPEAKEVIDQFSSMLNVLGTTVIVMATIFLGTKYMFGSFENKADVKENLIALLIACVFFFGWTSLWNILFTGGEFALTKGTTTYETAIARVFNSFTKVANFLAIGAVLYIGIRYIFAGASGKAELKSKSGQFIIGIIMAFCTVGLLNLISTIVNQLFS